MWANPDVARFIGGSPSTPQESWFRMLRYAGFWTLLGYGYWAITDATTGTFLGEAGFADFRRNVPMLAHYPEIGWALDPIAWGRGIATEAVRAVVEWGDANLPIPESRCIIDSTNEASVAVATKAGFQAIGETPIYDTNITVFSRSPPP
jgi:RimJ/RimL family protein N-acetyltransferase